MHQTKVGFIKLKLFPVTLLTSVGVKNPPLAGCICACIYHFGGVGITTCFCRGKQQKILSSRAIVLCDRCI